jgi:glycosyltransferase involved in cell wall biosynthesis
MNIDISGIAYTTKTDNFCRMMMSLGHEVFHYGVEGGAPPHCTEHIVVQTKQEQADWLSVGFEWDLRRTYWQETTKRTATAIHVRAKPKDFLCLVGGVCQKQIADAVGSDVMPVEIGIGYSAGGTFSKYRVFESYSQMAKVYGEQSADPTPSLYDAVIPGYVDETPFSLHENSKRGDYLLFVGRVIYRKGLQIALEVAKATNKKLYIVGPGGTQKGKLLTTLDGHEMPLGRSKYLGVVDKARRDTLLSRALAVLMPTIYLEPFGNVALEANMCGTPVITTDFGAFAETVQHGYTGYRCRTLAQFIAAVNEVGHLDRARIRKYAVANYGLDRISRMYEEYFGMLYDLWKNGWYTKRPVDLNWLRRKPY